MIDFRTIQPIEPINNSYYQNQEKNNKSKNKEDNDENKSFQQILQDKRDELNE